MKIDLAYAAHRLCSSNIDASIYCKQINAEQSISQTERERERVKEKKKGRTNERMKRRKNNTLE
jgi:hypothetical protein